MSDCLDCGLMQCLTCDYFEAMPETGCCCGSIVGVHPSGTPITLSEHMAYVERKSRQTA